jgi:hypothetical protein
VPTVRQFGHGSSAVAEPFRILLYDRDEHRGNLLRSAKARADLTVIRARAGLVRAGTALVNTARGLAKSYGERLWGCNVRNMSPEKAEELSPELATGAEFDTVHKRDREDGCR